MNNTMFRAGLSLLCLTVLQSSCSNQLAGSPGSPQSAENRPLDPRTPYRHQPPPELPRFAPTNSDHPRLPPQRTARPQLSGYSTYTFVIKELQFDEPSATSRYGFNPDGRTSDSADNGGCNKPDFQSRTLRSLNVANCVGGSQYCTGGVDNALPELMDVFDNSVGLPFRAHANRWINDGRAYWILRITYVDDTTNDSEIEGHLFRAYTTDSSCGVALSGYGSFNVDSNFVLAGDTEQPVYRFAGSIVDKQLHLSRNAGWANATLTPVPISFGVSSSNAISFYLYQAQFNMLATDLANSSVSGMMGGWANTDALSYSIELAFPSHATQVFYLMPKLSDLASPSGGCDTGNPIAIGGLSMGAGITLVPATIVGVASGPGAGTCGASW